MKEYPAEVCANCGRTIGRLEPAMVHPDHRDPGRLHIVCAQCHALLSGPATPTAATPASAEAVVPTAPAVPAAPPTNWAKGIFWLIFWLFFGGPMAVGVMVFLWLYVSPDAAVWTFLGALCVATVVAALQGRVVPPDAPPDSANPPEVMWPDS